MPAGSVAAGGAWPAWASSLRGRRSMWGGGQYLGSTRPRWQGCCGLAVHGSPTLDGAAMGSAACGELGGALGPVYLDAAVAAWYPPCPAMAAAGGG
jgi:hypothetical protein